MATFCRFPRKNELRTKLIVLSRPKSDLVVTHESGDLRLMTEKDHERPNDKKMLPNFFFKS